MLAEPARAAVRKYKMKARIDSTIANANVLLFSRLKIDIFRVIPGEVVAGKNMSRVVGNRQARFSEILDISLPS